MSQKPILSAFILEPSDLLVPSTYLRTFELRFVLQTTKKSNRQHTNIFTFSSRFVKKVQVQKDPPPKFNIIFGAIQALTFLAKLLM